MIWTENAPTEAGWYWIQRTQESEDAPEYTPYIGRVHRVGGNCAVHYASLTSAINARWGSKDGTTPTKLEPPTEG